MKSSRQNINLSDRPPGLPFSDAALADNTLYIAGRIGILIPGDRGFAPPNVDEELRILFEDFFPGTGGGR